MATMQPMGPGVGRPSMTQEAAVEGRARVLQEQALQEAARFEQRLREDPLLSLLKLEMEQTMLRAYLDSEEGKAQYNLLKKLKVSIDPQVVARGVTEHLLGPHLANIVRTSAAP